MRNAPSQRSAGTVREVRHGSGSRVLRPPRLTRRRGLRLFAAAALQAVPLAALAQVRTVQAHDGPHHDAPQPHEAIATAPMAIERREDYLELRFHEGSVGDAWPLVNRLWAWRLGAERTNGARRPGPAPDGLS